MSLVITNENAPLAGTGEALGNAIDISDFNSDAVRQQVLASEEHLSNMRCFNGVHDKLGQQLDIRSLFNTQSVAADPKRATPKLDAKAIMLSAIPKDTILLDRAEYEPDAMAMLATDFDTGNLSLREVRSAAVDFFGEQTIATVFSTASSMPDRHRWRLFIPLNQPQPVSVWLKLQRGFAHYLHSLGHEVDATANRCKQLHFLPNVPMSITDKEGCETTMREPFSGMPLHFEHTFWGHCLLNPQDLSDTALKALAELDELDKAAEVVRQQQAEEAANKRQVREALRQKKLAAGLDAMTPIERFNAEHELETLMINYDYIEDSQKPGHWRSPLQTSSTFATIVREDGTWFSLSGSDIAAGLGTKQGVGVGGDAFDLYVHFDHKGNRAKAVASYAQQLSTASAFSGIGNMLFGGLVRTGLKADGRGGYPASKHNLVAALQLEGFCYATRYDSFLGEVMVQETGTQEWRPVREDDYFNAARCLEAQDFRSISTTNMREAIQAAARERTFDCAQDWLNGLPAWDGVDRVSIFLEKAFGVQSSEYHIAISRYLWSALAGRVIEPGCKADMVPVASGTQGVRKSTTVKAISPFEEAFGELNLATEEANQYREMRGRLVMELPELSGLRKREVEDLKRFISSTSNVWIEKYQTAKTSYLRRCVFFGTTNQTEILNDPTGSRRWLPFECGECNPQWVIDNRDQLWAQGTEIFKAAGVQWEDAMRLAHEAHENFRAGDPWEMRIEQWLNSVAFDGKPVDKSHITTTEVMTALGIPTTHQNRATEMRIGVALKALGYERIRQAIAGRRSYVFVKTPR